MSRALADPTLGQAAQVFLRIGLLSFGGPAAQIALMHRMLVDENPWLTERQYLNALSFCMLLPGPEAMQLATYAGWRLHGTIGGLIAGLLFVMPGAIVIATLAMFYIRYGDAPLVGTLFLGIKAAVLIIVFEALMKVSKRALQSVDRWIIAALAFVGIFFLSLPFPLIILAAGLYGAIFAARPHPADAQATPVRSNPNTLKTIAIGLIVWLLPLLALDLLTGQVILGEIGLFFSKLAVVTFGGAYAVLAYMAQDVVTKFGWLTADQMMDGLGLAETTPGPLILVTQFVGHIAGFGAGGYGAAIWGGLITLWATFVPCFIWIFAGAPYIDRISAHPRLAGALQAITAAVVGVIVNLSVWFGLHVLFADVAFISAGPLTLWTPDIATLDWNAAVLAVLAGILLLRQHIAVGWVLVICAGAAWGLALIGQV